jgi:hypothetical protein
MSLLRKYRLGNFEGYIVAQLFDSKHGPSDDIETTQFIKVIASRVLVRGAITE